MLSVFFVREQSADDLLLYAERQGYRAVVAPEDVGVDLCVLNFLAQAVGYLSLIHI